MDNKRLGITWQLSDTHGWGIFGLNLVVNLISLTDTKPLLFSKPHFQNVSAEKMIQLQPLIDEQKQVQTGVIDRAGNQKVSVNGVPILHALANGFRCRDRIRGQKNIGFIFFEEGNIDDIARQRAQDYELILAGSSWNRDYARSNGITNIEYISQGIDTDIFKPGITSGNYEGRFTIFSGGKLELRKGQDIVLAAFKAFHTHHPDALLITSWGNAWPGSALGMINSTHISSDPEIGLNGEINIENWAAANGVDPSAFVDLGWVPNSMMPEILHDMDVAVFPNRCEGGTNLVAMEAMACGIPTILSANTGHLDLLMADNCFPLLDQAVVTSETSPHEMWRESRVEEIVEQLEFVYQNREESRYRAENGALSMASMSWAHQTRKLMQAIQKWI